MDKGVVALVDNDNMSLLFRAIGFDASVENHSSIKNALYKALKSNKIIYLSSSFASICQPILQTVLSATYPIVTLIDTSRDNTSSIDALDSQAKKIFGENFTLRETNR